MSGHSPTDGWPEGDAGYDVVYRPPKRRPRLLRRAAPVPRGAAPLPGESPDLHEQIFGDAPHPTPQTPVRAPLIRHMLSADPDIARKRASALTGAAGAATAVAVLAARAHRGFVAGPAAVALLATFAVAVAALGMLRPARWGVAVAAAGLVYTGAPLLPWWAGSSGALVAAGYLIVAGRWRR